MYTVSVNRRVTDGINERWAHRKPREKHARCAFDLPVNRTKLRPPIRPGVDPGTTISACPSRVERGPLEYKQCACGVQLTVHIPQLDDERYLGSVGAARMHLEGECAQRVSPPWQAVARQVGCANRKTCRRAPLGPSALPIDSRRSAGGPGVLLDNSRPPLPVRAMMVLGMGEQPRLKRTT